MDTSKYIEFPNFDQVIFHIYGPLALRWYSLAYIMGIILGWFYIKFIIKKYNSGKFSLTHLDDMVAWIVVGVVLGGRLGHILFYDLWRYLNDPISVFKVWEGGMSFHGGLIGVILACYFFAKSRKIPFLQVADLMALTAPIGLGLGRIANFINGEIFGRVTDVSWAVLFPAGGYLPRHPSQLYEAFLEGIVLFALVNLMALRKNRLAAHGYASGLFLLWYGSFRIFVEFFREPDAHIGYLFGLVSMGQLISIPLLGVGYYLLNQSKKA